MSTRGGAMEWRRVGESASVDEMTAINPPPHPRIPSSTPSPHPPHPLIP
ncbi:MAG: hypothetical protein HC769_06555 [Cyanobacteria bacterium CRU_2_1]|nr:hypothetical protein [Cyanobacteria bacterium CRU_2_1]